MTNGGRGTVTTKAKPDDLKAVKTIRDALVGFQNDERERILRWVRESLGLPTGSPAIPAGTETKQPAPMVHQSTPASPATAVPAHAPDAKTAKDIATFVNEKNPQSDIQLATTVAYYYHFEAPPNERKDEIDADFLRDALRLAGRPGKLTQPLKTLNNAHAKGLLDRGSERGNFTINTVGENLVGMTLPGGSAQSSRPRRPAARKKAARSRG
jgi:hypothetical protein